ncbi:hypothetical protein ACQ4PT_065985 [Festuca glaucescens]
MPSPASSHGGCAKRGRDPKEDVYVDNLNSHKRYLSEVDNGSLNGLYVGDSLADNIMESLPGRRAPLVSADNGPHTMLDTALKWRGPIMSGDRDINLEGLVQIEKDGKFEWRKDREDVHLNTEEALIERVGELTNNLHAARSKNDQIVMVYF